MSISRPRPRRRFGPPGCVFLGFGDVASSSAGGHPRMTSRLFDALGTEPLISQFRTSHFLRSVAVLTACEGAFPSQCCRCHCVRGRARWQEGKLISSIMDDSDANEDIRSSRPATMHSCRNQYLLGATRGCECFTLLPLNSIGQRREEKF